MSRDVQLYILSGVTNSFSRGSTQPFVPYCWPIIMKCIAERCPRFLPDSWNPSRGIGVNVERCQVARLVPGCRVYTLRPADDGLTS